LQTQGRGAIATYFRMMQFSVTFRFCTTNNRYTTCLALNC